jgi:hypothetical protein
MSQESITAIEPVPVAVTNFPQPAQPSKTKYKRRAATLTTVIISATNPIQKILPMSPNRCAAYLINYTDADIVVCHSENHAVKVSQLTDFTEQVDGALIQGGARANGIPIPLDTTDDLWVTTNATAIAAGIIRVAVLDYVYAED